SSKSRRSTESGARWSCSTCSPGARAGVSGDSPMTINTTRWNRVRYTLWAPLYDRVASFTRQRRRSIELLGLRPGERVLVDGAGTGADLAFIPPGVAVVAIDLTPAMVPRIRRRAASLGRPVDARVMDAEHLDFPDASFDAVILHLI